MKLDDLRRYLGSRKLKFLEDPDGPHFNYRPIMGGQQIALPTVLRVSHGRGETDFNNIKGVAQALGLRVRELEISEACGLGRFCVLLKMAFHLVNWSRQRGDSADARRGAAAMIESVRILVAYTARNYTKGWNDEEEKVLGDMRPELEQWKKTPELSEIAAIMLSQINRQ